MKNFFLVLLLLSSLKGIAQVTDDSTAHFTTKGFLIGYGPTFSDNTEYTVYYITGDFSWSFGKAKKRDFLSLYCEPQFNTVKTDRTDFEFGVNLGLRNYFRFNNGFHLYMMLGSGPHYISAQLERQATGFIFSDNLDLGGLIPLNDNLALNLQAGVRHISNAGLKLPNRGVNSYTFRAGLSGINWRRPVWKRRKA
jgi:hypothetical protein